MSTQVEVDIFDLKGTIDAFKWLYDNLDKQMEEMLDEIVNKGTKYSKKLYSKGVDDPNLGNVSVDIRKSKNNRELVAHGDGIIYREFGTGDEGERQPHKAKSRFDLDDYNSGGTITDIADIVDEDVKKALAENGVTSGKFWYYNKETSKGNKVSELTDEQKLARARYLINHSDEVEITQGVPAGQEMWDTRWYIRKEIPKIAKKRGKIINDNIIKSIKR